MFLILVLLSVTVLYCWLKRDYSYWERKGVPGPKPKYIVGNVIASILRQKSIGEIVTDLYREYEGYPFVGFYRTLTPCLILRDVDLIKSVTVKDFPNFHDNDFFITTKSDVMFGGNPFVLKGSEWKEKRSHLVFTSGKMKSIFSKIVMGAEDMVGYLEKELKNGNKTFESKDFCCTYTLQTVLSCAYGVSIKCFGDPESTFIKLGKDQYEINFIQLILFYLSTLYPRIAKVVSVRFTKKETEDELFDLIRSSLKYRDEHGVKSKDFLGSLAPLRSQYSEDEVLSLAASIFLDGQETSGLVMGCFLYELAANPEVQEKLRKEVKEYFKKDGGHLSYESVHEMPYLQACFKENLRMHSILHFLPRTCTEDYTYHPTDESHPPLVIEKGTPVMVPLYGIHYDPKHYKNPYTFRPERFLDKQVADKYCFLGFRDGPRACVGRRFGSIQVKAGVAHILKDFEMAVNSKTKLPLKADPWDFLVVPIEGMWLDFRKLGT